VSRRLQGLKVPGRKIGLVQFWPGEAGHSGMQQGKLGWLQGLLGWLQGLSRRSAPWHSCFVPWMCEGPFTIGFGVASQSKSGWRLMWGSHYHISSLV
jgi:hypothetical protein